LGFPVGNRGEPVFDAALGNAQVLDELAREVSKRLAPVKGQCPAGGCQNGAAGSVGNGRSSREGGKARRRELLRLVKVFACTPAPLDALERFAASLHRPSAVDEALVRDVERLIAAVGAAYDTTTARKLLVPARLLVERTTRLLDGSMFSGERERLLRCASEGSLVIGWLRFNLDQRADARASFLLAQGLAHEARDDVVQARALGAMSCAYSTTYQGGAAGKALELAVQANAVLPEHAPAGVCSWLAMREAAEHAASRHASEYQQLAERAEGAVSQAQSELGVFGAWDDSFLNGHKGKCLWLLQQPAAAEQALLAGLTHASLARQKTQIARNLATVYAVQDDAEAACGMARQALGFVLDIRYVLGLQRLLVVRKGFPGEWANLSYVQELDEQLRLAMRKLRVS